LVRVYLERPGARGVIGGALHELSPFEGVSNVHGEPNHTEHDRDE
jgi:hypothetical protein